MNELLPDDYIPDWLDQSWFENRERGMALPILLLAVLFGYLFLVAQYESWMIPVPVMMTAFTFVLASTLVGVLLVPSLYAIFQRLCDRDAPSHGESTLW